MVQKKKILFLIHTLQVGGAEKVLVNLVNNMDKSKYDITVMTVVNTGAFRKELYNEFKYKTIFNIPNVKKKSNGESGNILNKTSKIKKFLLRLYGFFWRHVDCKKIYKRYIKDEYDVEIAFLEGVATKIISASTNKNSKKIAWLHVDLVKETKTDKFFKSTIEEKKIYEHFDNIVAVSKVVKDQFISKFSFEQKEKVIVRYNVIDEKAIYQKSKEKLPIEKTKFTLCTIGRLASQKGYSRLLKIVKKLNDDGLVFELWIIGVGPEERLLKDFIQENNLQNVVMLGYQKNPYKYLTNADAFVCSSIAEGFSTVVSEAIILGKPVITTDCAGMKEMLGENDEFGIVTENSENGLYNGLNKFLSDEKIYDFYKKQILKRKDMFSLKKAVSEVEKLIEE